MIKWYRIHDIADKLTAINIIIGGRGIGKTYSALDYIVNTGQPFIYLRNTDVQMKESATSFGNPFKRWNLDHGRDIYFKTEKNHYLIYGRTDDEISVPIGYGVALSTFENMRGVDLSDVSYVLFDEFIEKRTLSFNQFTSFVSFYETVNRNRELLGDDPLKVILLSNSQSLNNPILIGYNLIPQIEQMIKSGQKEFRKPGLYLAFPESEVSEAKAATANYQLINGTKIADEALANKFAFDSFYGIIKRKLVEYVPIVQIDDIYIYKHKSGGKLYACNTQAQNIPTFTSRDNMTAFLRGYGRRLMDAAATGKLEYSDFLTKTKLLTIIL